MAKSRKVQPKKGWIVGSRPAVASFFGVDPTTVKDRWCPRGMPGENGRYDLRAIARWLAERLKTAGGGAGAQGELSEMDRLRLERLRNSVELERIKIDEKLGKLVDAAGARLAQQQQAAAFVGLLDRLPAEFRGYAGCSKRVTESLTECLRALREDMSRE